MARAADKLNAAKSEASVESPASEEVKPPKYDWADPQVPAGNAPPMPRWPLYASAVAFGLWLLFLVAMAIVRVRTVSV